MIIYQLLWQPQGVGSEECPNHVITDHSQEENTQSLSYMLVVSLSLHTEGIERMPSFIRRLRDRFVRGRTQRRRSLYDKPSRERHPVSFASSILTVLTIVTGLSLPEWASSNSSKCHCVFGLTQVTCVNPQSTEGNCETLASREEREESNRESESKTYNTKYNTNYLTNIQTCTPPLSLSPVTAYYKTSHEILISCMLSISVLTIISSLIAAIISCGYPREKLEFIRHLSIFNIVSSE